MESSLHVPTATSVRAVPAKLLFDNRVVINNHLRRARGGKVSFTHLIGYAVVKALAVHPEMNNAFGEVKGKPAVLTPSHVNLGIAIDLAGKNGSRSLVVASIKRADTLDFATFWGAYEDIIRRARNGKLTTEDFAGTTISITNPGTIGTNHSVPRLMQGQGTIIGVGSMEYPAEFSGMNPDQLVDRAISKTMTLTSTYDHRIIQGAQSGEFLRTLHTLLLSDDFIDEVFTALRIPYEPVRWRVDRDTSHEGQIGKNSRVIELINSYRSRGHLMADTDPLEYTVRKHPDLDITQHGLTLWDLDREFPVGGFAGEKLMKLRDILGVLRDAYCRRVGVEYMHITDPEQRRWIQERIEVKHEQPTREEQLHVLGRLNVAEAFETFLQTKYVGQKRFSLEGAETVIALLDAVLAAAAHQQLDEVVVGMPHRGRLNVLANIVGKPYSKIFNEFEGNIDPGTAQGSGDVKYHLGAEGTFRTPDGDQIAVTLTANPSHLEAVDPVLEGIVRAKQDLLDKSADAGFTVLPVLMHGDAAFAGQGVVAETLNLSQLRGYRTGGTVHVVVNNQVGFTTSPTASRSSLYCTDIARMIAAPIFHVNGDDPEACVRVAQLAVEFRREFEKDVVIDMVCYRRRGHNEADNPSFTQPQMYDIIDAKRSVRKLYTEALVGRGDITLEDAEAALKDFQTQLEKVFVETRNATGKAVPEPDIEQETPSQQLTTAIPVETIKRIAEAYANPPDGFTVHPRLKPQIDRRIAMASSGDVDWATAELFAFGSLVLDGRVVRLSGQDSRRGTFTQRHATLVDRNTGAEYTPLRNLTPEKTPFMAYDSLLSEYAAMGFEYGYSVVRDDALVCWEAQFGDFADGAQTIIDEFISSGEAKWGQRSAVTLLLPHGQEGQGPDHSSGRPERFLQLSRREQHDDRDVLVAGELLPPAAAPGALAGAPSAGGVHAQVAAAAEVGGQPARRVHQRRVPAGDGRFARRCGRSAPGAAVHRQGLLRPGGRARPGRAQRRRDRADGAAVPVAQQRDRRPSSPSTPAPSWCGCRRSRPIRARGRSWRSTCPSTCPAARCCAPRAAPPRRPPSARSRCTRRSRKRSSRPPSPDLAGPLGSGGWSRSGGACWAPARSQRRSVPTSRAPTATCCRRWARATPTARPRSRRSTACGPPTVRIENWSTTRTSTSCTSPPPTPSTTTTRCWRCGPASRCSWRRPSR